MIMSIVLIIYIVNRYFRQSSSTYYLFSAYLYAGTIQEVMNHILTAETFINVAYYYLSEWSECV